MCVVYYHVRFLEIWPLMVKFSKFCFESLLRRHWSTLLCWNIVKFVRREIGETVCHSHDKKSNFSSLLNCRYCADRAQNLPGPAKSVHFRRSYTRTCESRSLSPWSKSTIRLTAFALRASTGNNEVQMYNNKVMLNGMVDRRERKRTLCR